MFFYTRCAFCGAPVSNEKFYFSKSNSNSPFLGILPSLPSRATLALPELPQPCGHMALTPLRSILHVVFMSAPPAIREQIKADPCQIPRPIFPVLAPGLLQERCLVMFTG